MNDNLYSVPFESPKNKKITCSNAYTFSFPFNRFIIYDGKINDLATLNAIVAHELSHVKYYDSFTIFLVFYSTLLCYGILFYYVYDKIQYEETGNISRTVFIVCLYLAFYSTTHCLYTAFIINPISNIMEYRADMFAKDLGYAKDLVEYLYNRFSVSKYSTSILFSTFFQNHPSNEIRIHYFLSK